MPHQFYPMGPPGYPMFHVAPHIPVSCPAPGSYSVPGFYPGPGSYSQPGFYPAPGSYSQPVPLLHGPPTDSWTHDHQWNPV